MKSQLCTLWVCSRTSTAARTGNRETPRVLLVKSTLKNKLLLISKYILYLSHNIYKACSGEKKKVLNLSSGYRHFIWSLHRNPKQCHKVPGKLAKIKPSGPCTLLFSNLFFHLMCQSKLLLQHGQNQPGWIYNASNCYGHIFVNCLETNR